MARRAKSLLQNGAKERYGARAHREHRSKKGRRQRDKGKLALLNWWKEKGERKRDRRVKQFLRQIARR